MILLSAQFFSCVVICILLDSFYIRSAKATTRRATLNTALFLECREEEFIRINDVKLGLDEPYCTYSLRADHSDYIRVVSHCSGRQSCSNIILRDSQRIQCGRYGIQSSQFLSVDYSCVPKQMSLNICHETIRTISPYEGYISSPSYPNDLEDPDPHTLCKCEISALTSNAAVELLLLDMTSSDQILLSSNSTNSTPLCNKQLSSRCINDIETTNKQSVNLLYYHKPANNVGFLLLYAAVDKTSRVRAVCSMTYINVTTTTLNSPTTVIIESEENLDEIDKDNTIGVEVIAGITVAAILILICVIVSILLCRKHSSRNTSSSGPLEFKVMPPGNRRTYDLVTDEHIYAAPNQQLAGGDNFYHEPFNYRPAPDHSETASLTREYSEPASLCDNNAEDGVYESLEDVNTTRLLRPSRFNRMKKSGSMPQHPAPPIPSYLASNLLDSSQSGINTNTSNVHPETNQISQSSTNDATRTSASDDIQSKSECEYLQPSQLQAKKVKAFKGACSLVDNDLYNGDS